MIDLDPGPLKAYRCESCGNRWGAFRKGRFRRTCLRCGARNATPLGPFTHEKIGIKKISTNVVRVKRRI